MKMALLIAGLVLCGLGSWGWGLGMIAVAFWLAAS